MKRFCGIDLASYDKNPTGITFLEAAGSKLKVKSIEEIHTDNVLVNLINKNNPEITSIDAPFKVGTTTFRKCETQLTALGFKLLPPSFLIELVKRNQLLIPHLKGNLIEVHPLTSKKALGFDVSNQDDLIQQLADEISEIPDRELSPHEIDSLVGAYTAYLHSQERTKSYGDSEGYIVIPVPKIKLAVFDLDGTITKPVSSWEYIHRELGTWEKYGQKNLEDFISDNIDYNQFAQRDAAPWAGTSVEKLDSIVDSIEYMDGVEELIQKLQDSGVEVAVISGGLACLGEKIAKDFQINHIFANDLNLKDGCLDGTVNVVVDYNGKLKIYKKLLKMLKVKPYEVMTVGDSSGDIVLFENSGLSFTINPLDNIVEKTADYKVESISEISEFLGL